MAKRNRLIYKALDRNVPSLLHLQLNDKFRYNQGKGFYWVVDVYQSWAVGFRRHSKGYCVTIISQHDYSCLDLEEHDYHIVFSDQFNFKGPRDEGYRLIQTTIHKEIDRLNRGFAYESTNCVYDLVIEKETKND